MAPKKIPMRKCLGCGEMLPQKELVRVVKTKIKEESEGEEEKYVISLDLIGKRFRVVSFIALEQFFT